jgi:hypothetical protein
VLQRVEELQIDLADRVNATVIVPSHDYAGVAALLHHLPPPIGVCHSVLDGVGLYARMQRNPACQRRFPNLVLSDARLARVLQAILAETVPIPFVDPRFQLDSLLAAVGADQVFPEVPPALCAVMVADAIGSTTARIAAQLGVTEATVRRYRQRIYDRLGLDRVGVRQLTDDRLAAWAARPRRVAAWAEEMLYG